MARNIQQAPEHMDGNLGATARTERMPSPLPLL